MTQIHNRDALKMNVGDFGEKIVAERTPIIELNGALPLSDLRDDIQTSGSGEVVDNSSEYFVKHNAAGDFAKLTSSERGRYVPGNTSEVGIGVRMEGQLDDGDIEAKWGYFEMETDSNGQPLENVKNGFLFGQDTNGMFIEIIKSGQTLEKKYRNEWNTDRFKMDTKEGLIYQIAFAYYGYGIIKFQAIKFDDNNEQRTVDLHITKIKNETSLSNSNLKVGGLLRSTNSTNTPILNIAGRQFSTIGKYVPNTRITSERHLNVSVPTTEFTPLLSMQRKTDNRETPIELYGFEILSDQDLELDIRLDGDLTGATFNDISNTQVGETTLEVDKSSTNIDINSGIKLDQNFINGGVKNSDSSVATQKDLPLSLPDNSKVTISARALSTDANVNAILKIREEY